VGQAAQVAVEVPIEPLGIGGRAGLHALDQHRHVLRQGRRRGAIAPPSETQLEEPPVASSTRLLEHGPLHVGGATVFEEQGELRAVGHDWKAEFSADGVRFTPALGERAPHNLSLDLSLVEVRQGAVRHAGWSERELVHDARSVRYDLGQGRVERFEVDDAGLSLAIDFPAPLADGGELVARYRIESELELTHASSTGLTYSGEYGGVEVSGVFGVDANGWRVAGELRPQGEFLDLVLPAEFVENAVWPIELDPTLAPFANFGFGGSPSVCFDDWSDFFLVTWQTSFSATDSDIHGRRIDKNGVTQGSLIALESASGTLAQNPAVAVDHAAQMWVVAWSTSSGLFAPAQIELRTVNVFGGLPAFGTQVPTSGSSQQLPSLCSGNAVGSQDVVLCWREAGNGVRVAKVAVAGGFPTLGAPVVVTTDSTADAPSISKTTRSTGRVLVAWSAEDTNGDDAIYVRGFGSDLTTSTPVELLYSGGGDHVGYPACDGNGRRWLVLFEEDEPSFAQRIRLGRVEWAPDGTLETSAFGTFGAGGDGYRPDVALTGDEFGVIFNETAASGSELQFARTSITNLGSTRFDPASWPLSTVLQGGQIAFPFAANGTHKTGNNVGCAVWRHSDGSIYAGSAELVEGIEVIDPGCIGTESAFCSAPRLNSDLYCLLDTDMPAMPTVFLLGFSQSLLPCGDCAIRPVTTGGGILQILVTDSLGNAQLDFQVPGGIQNIGLEAFVQWLPAVPEPPCPDFGLGASKVLRLEIFAD
jgi:hypothetical protein